MKSNRIFAIAVSTLVLVASMLVAWHLVAGDSTDEAQQGPAANLFIDWSSQFHNPPWQACDYLPITPGTTTVLDLMNVAGSNCTPSIQFTYTGSGASAFLTSIGGVVNNQNGNGYYWVYLVNGHSPSIGFGAYTLSDGDSAVWDYKHFSSGLSQATKPSK